jgi:Glycosyl transferase family 2
MPPVTDIIMLTHNRLEHLVATVDALEQRTQAPYRLTIVDNASGPDVRNWLSSERHRFHRVILRPVNEFLRSLNVGIAETVSDPFMVTDPDLIVPELEPCWLTRLHTLMARHPDFGLLGVGLDQSNLPSVQEPEQIDASEIVDGEIVERPVGSVLTLIRRDALVAPYETDWATCQSVERAGYRYGWAPEVRAYHLGWDDYRLYPSHLASKLKYGEYREVNLIERPPTLPELALAGPVVAVTRERGIPDGSVLELTWARPAVAAALPQAVGVERPDPADLPFADASAGAVVLVDPPPGAEALVHEATRVAARAVIAVASLEAFDARSAAELAPPGWKGREAAGPGDVSLALAESAGSNGLAERLGVSTVEDRERWLTLFAAGAFGAGRRRLWIWERLDDRTAPPVPETVRYDHARVSPWQPLAVPPTPPHRSLGTRLRERAARELRLAAEVARIRAARLSRSTRGA